MVRGVVEKDAPSLEIRGGLGLYWEKILIIGISSQEMWSYHHGEWKCAEHASAD